MSNKPIKILVVEDDREDYLITQDTIYQIDNSAYSVDWEKDYHEAINNIMEQKHDVYLIDYNLGPYSGIDLVKHCVTKDINLPFIFLTGMNDIDVDKQAMTAGATDFLVKDEINPGILERSIRYAIKQKKTELELIDANRTKDKLFSIISHDLRSPLSTLMSTINLLTEENEDFDDNMKNNIMRELAESSKSTFDLLDNLLFWSRSQIGSISFEPVMMNLSEQVKELFSLFINQARLKSITLNNNVPDTLEVLADTDMLKLILRNLISNALKFTNEKGCIEVGALKKSSMVLLHVKDNGLGMDETIKKAILNPHIFKSRHGTNNESGSGLGLKIVQEFINKHHGKCWIDSKVGVGTTFYFSLPVVR